MRGSGKDGKGGVPGQLCFPLKQSSTLARSYLVCDLSANIGGGELPGGKEASPARSLQGMTVLQVELPVPHG